MYRSIFYGIILTLLFVLGSLVYIVKKTLTKDFLGVFAHIDKRYLILSLLFMFLYHTFDNLRLFVLSRAMNLKYSFFYGYIISFINTFGATITPAHMGGEFMSVYTLSRKGGRLHKVISIVTMKTITGMVFFILAFPYAMSYLYKNPKQSLRILGLFFFFLVLFSFLYLLLKAISKRNFGENKKFIQKIKYTFKRYLVVSRIFLRDKKLSILLASISSVFLYLSFLSSGAFLVKSFNPEYNLFTLIEHQIMLLYAIFLSPTPGGSGVGEVGALYVFDAFLEASLLGGFSILWRFITQYMSALLGGIFLLFLVIKDSRRFTHA
ncbi:flippase-like domain-containing protein [Thermodesulfovibrio sp.]|uniref:flippase-like domain-containing protein n=1 Tax=Pseudomonadati TaxID=3379134 RepID=UPI000E7F1922|nr:flippase-like domain-containing protein [Aquificaceae bacterium]QWK12810.1 MAG: flippase-like domain-containing protein [Aquificota bacterium]HAV40373.1 hypothetical protein [Aquificaceae bacterium]